MRSAETAQRHGIAMAPRPAVVYQRNLQGTRGATAVPVTVRLNETPAPAFREGQPRSWGALLTFVKEHNSEKVYEPRARFLTRVFRAMGVTEPEKLTDVRPYFNTRYAEMIKTVEAFRTVNNASDRAGEVTAPGADYAANSRLANFTHVSTIVKKWIALGCDNAPKAAFAA